MLSVGSGGVGGVTRVWRRAARSDDKRASCNRKWLARGRRSRPEKEEEVKVVAGANEGAVVTSSGRTSKLAELRKGADLGLQAHQVVQTGRYRLTKQRSCRR